MLKYGQRMLALDTVERDEKFIEADAIFEIAEESIHGNARVEKARSAA